MATRGGGARAEARGGGGGAMRRLPGNRNTPVRLAPGTRPARSGAGPNPRCDVVYELAPYWVGFTALTDTAFRWGKASGHAQTVGVSELIISCLASSPRERRRRSI